MSALAKISIVGLVVAIIAAPAATHATVGPQDTYQYSLVDPNPRFGFRFSDALDTPNWFFVSTYGSGCDAFLLGTPRPVDDLTYGRVLHDWYQFPGFDEYSTSWVDPGRFGGIRDAGPIGAASGFERRDDTSDFRPDEFLSAGDVLDFNSGEPTIGGYDATEFFGEIDIPLLSVVTGAESLAFWAAGRSSIYSNMGNDSSYTGAIDWAPIEHIRLRGSYQRAVRAPNVSELFGGQGSGFPGAVDPCSGTGPCVDFGFDSSMDWFFDEMTQAALSSIDRVVDEPDQANLDESEIQRLSHPQEFEIPIFVSILGLDSYTFISPGLEVSTKFREGFYREQNIGGTTYGSVFFEAGDRAAIKNALYWEPELQVQINPCRSVKLPSDPNYLRTGRHSGGSWGQEEDDQWAIKRVGYTDDDNSAWNLVPESAAPVVVAVIDTGLDWYHHDISSDNIWRNDGEDPDNGVDDDGNGYIDDVIGWNFIADNNKPWDFDGHGTLIAGIIAATQDNGVGIAGINPHAKIMVVKAVSDFGFTRASFIAEAIVYAVDNGAQIINLSVGGELLNDMEQAAINMAHQAGVLVVAAAGNEAMELDDYGPGGAENVLTVGATHVDDRAAAFSNFGDKVDIVAPGVDVLSLRARSTDANYRPGQIAPEEYSVGDNYVGEDKRYLYASGTSFSAPIVAATASLMMSKNPELTADEVRELLLQTATDIEAPGKDKYAGHGMLNATAALSADPGFSITAEITALQLQQIEDGPEVIRVVGTIDASDFKRAWMQIGAGENPGGWKYVGQKRKYPIINGTLGTIPVSEFAGADVWQVVINVEHDSGVVKSAAYPIKIK